MKDWLNKWGYLCGLSLYCEPCWLRLAIMCTNSQDFRWVSDCYWPYGKYTGGPYVTVVMDSQINPSIYMTPPYIWHGSTARYKALTVHGGEIFYATYHTIYYHSLHILSVSSPTYHTIYYHTLHILGVTMYYHPLQVFLWDKWHKTSLHSTVSALYPAGLLCQIYCKFIILLATELLGKMRDHL